MIAVQFLLKQVKLYVEKVYNIIIIIYHLYGAKQHFKMI